jgi:FkbM family methyltransferase
MFMIFNTRNIARGKRLLKSMIGKDVWSAPEIEVPNVRLGSIYGGWTICTGVGLGSESVIYSVGVGEDISFDLSLIKALGCKIFAFDPTPRSIAWLRTQQLPKEFQFFPWGLGAIDGLVNFIAPEDMGHVSYSSAAVRGDAVQCEVYRLPTIMRKLGHAKIDLLKMDIEGSEYEVINDLLTHNLRPRQLLTEFHHGSYGIKIHKTASALNRLKAIGYRIFSISPSGREYSFLLKTGHVHGAFA